MKKTICAILFFFFSATIHAADPWSSSDKTREAIYLTLHIVDWGQTLDIAKNPDQYTEKNPILGEYPSVGRVNIYFFTTALLHVGAVHVLPSRWRPYFQYFWIATETSVVSKNYRAGIRINF